MPVWRQASYAPLFHGRLWHHEGLNLRSTDEAIVKKLGIPSTLFINTVQKTECGALPSKSEITGLVITRW